MGRRMLVETKVYGDGLIKQETILDDDGIRKSICTEIIRTKDAQIIECLIKLGWTPPPTGAGEL